MRVFGRTTMLLVTSSIPSDIRSKGNMHRLFAIFYPYQTYVRKTEKGFYISLHH